MDSISNCVHCWHQIRMDVISTGTNYQYVCCHCGETKFEFIANIMSSYVKDDKVHGPYWSSY